MLFLSSIVSLKLAFKHADHLNLRRRKTLTMIWLSPLAAASGIQTRRGTDRSAPCQDSGQGWTSKSTPTGRHHLGPVVHCDRAGGAGGRVKAGNERRLHFHEPPFHLEVELFPHGVGGPPRIAGTNAEYSCQYCFISSAKGQDFTTPAVFCGPYLALS